MLLTARDYYRKWFRGKNIYGSLPSVPEDTAYPYYKVQKEVLRLTIKVIINVVALAVILVGIMFLCRYYASPMIKHFTGI